MKTDNKRLFNILLWINLGYVAFLLRSIGNVIKDNRHTCERISDKLSILMCYGFNMSLETQFVLVVSSIISFLAIRLKKPIGLLLTNILFLCNYCLFIQWSNFSWDLTSKITASIICTYCEDFVITPTILDYINHNTFQLNLFGSGRIAFFPFLINFFLLFFNLYVTFVVIFQFTRKPTS